MAKILISGDSWACGEFGNYSAIEPLFHKEQITAVRA